MQTQTGREHLRADRAYETGRWHRTWCPMSRREGMESAKQVMAVHCDSLDYNQTVEMP